MTINEKDILCSVDDYTISRHHEDTILTWPDGRISVGDHYGDPTCAVINPSNNWCLSGGEGLVICCFEGGMPCGPGASNPPRITMRELWRRTNPPPDGTDAWQVEGAWLYENDTVRVLVDPLSPEAGLYEVDVRTRVWRRL